MSHASTRAEPFGDHQPLPRARLAQFDAAGQCRFNISGTTGLGPKTGQSFRGVLSFDIESDGAIDAGALQFEDGVSMPVVGQATGRSIRLRVGSDPSTVITLVGSGVFPVDQCTSDLSGAFAGPALDNVGVWLAVGPEGG